VSAGRQQGLDPGHAGEVAIHGPQPPGGEHRPVVLQRLIQQRLPGLARLPGPARSGRAGDHAEGGPGGGAADPQLADLRGVSENLWEGVIRKTVVPGHVG
jgi:hypothetical protein